MGVSLVRSFHCSFDSFRQDLWEPRVTTEQPKVQNPSDQHLSIFQFLFEWYDLIHLGTTIFEVQVLPKVYSQGSGHYTTSKVFRN